MKLYKVLLGAAFVLGVNYLISRGDEKLLHRPPTMEAEQAREEGRHEDAERLDPTLYQETPEPNELEKVMQEEF